ncbi:MAG TPA: acyltransferase family protein, partial [Coriobacteriia bacterium]|nr:acyltransferase family protein [Coriobacteriia bacterium]
MKQRITGFDWARVVAAFSIVAFHVSPYRGVVNDLAFSWAVPFFFALSGFLNVRCADYAEPSWLATRLKRLAIPYALWTTMRLVDLSPITPVTLLKQYLLCAPTSTLWFLWTLMLCVTIAWFLRKRLTVTAIAAVAGVAALGYAVVCEWWVAFGPLGAWLHANPGYSLQLPFVWL